MQAVSKDRFFLVMGPRDVHPRVDVATLRDAKIVSIWEDRPTREVLGLSKGTGAEAEYFLVEKLAG